MCCAILLYLSFPAFYSVRTIKKHDGNEAPMLQFIILQCCQTYLLFYLIKYIVHVYYLHAHVPVLFNGY